MPVKKYGDGANKEECGKYNLELTLYGILITLLV